MDKNIVSPFLTHGVSGNMRDNWNRGSGNQRPHHLRHDSLKATQEAVADIQPEHIRSLQLSGPDCSIHGETLQPPSVRSSWLLAVHRPNQ